MCGVGDVEEDFVQTGTGVPIRDWSDDTLRDGPGAAAEN